MTQNHAEGPKRITNDRAPVRVGRVMLFLVVAAIALTPSGISRGRHDDERLNQRPQEQAIPQVAVITPQRGSSTRELVLPGNVDAFFSASIHGQVSGYVQEWRKDIGARVHRGDVLAIVDTPGLDQSIAVERSELAKAKANLGLANVTAERWNSLRASAAVSQQTADEKDSDALAKGAEVDAAQSNVDRLTARKAFAKIVAPFDGVVTARNVDVGSLVRTDSNNSEVLFTVADIHQMRIYVSVPESYAADFKEGMKATLELPEYPDRKFDAIVVTSSHAIDQRSRTLLVELLCDNTDRLLFPGAFTRASFQIPPDANIVTIPVSALLYRDNALQVATLGLDNRIALKTVHIARDLGTEVEITSGLSQDQRIAADPPDSIGDGEQVQALEVAGEKTERPPTTDSETTHESLGLAGSLRPDRK